MVLIVNDETGVCGDGFKALLDPLPSQVKQTCFHERIYYPTKDLYILSVQPY